MGTRLIAESELIRQYAHERMHAILNEYGGSDASGRKSDSTYLPLTPEMRIFFMHLLLMRFSMHLIMCLLAVLGQYCCAVAAAAIALALASPLAAAAAWWCQGCSSFCGISWLWPLTAVARNIYALQMSCPLGHHEP